MFPTAGVPVTGGVRGATGEPRNDPASAEVGVALTDTIRCQGEETAYIPSYI